MTALSILTRINLVVVGAMLLGLVASGIWLFRLEMRQAREQVSHEARLMLQTAQAMRTYTVEEVASALARTSDGTFAAQSVPSYAAQRTLDMLRREYPQYTYREVATNPTNLADLPADWEVQIIRDMRADAGTVYLSGQRETALGPVYYLARSIRITDRACLQCHGDPEDAPPALTDVYGTVNGFGWQLDEVIGAQIVTVPLTAPYRQARETFFTTMLSQVALFTVVVVAVNLMAMRFIRRPLMRLAESARRQSLGDTRSPELPPFETAELETLRRAVLRLSRSVAKAMAMLERRSPTDG